MRETFVVDGVPLRRNGDTVLSWLGADGKETEDPDKAVRFSFHVFPTGREELAIQVALDEVNGGIGATVDLERGLRNTHAGIVAALERQIWPDGRPEADTEDLRRAQTEQLAMAFALIGTVPLEADDEEGALLERKRAAYDRMAAIRDQQEMAACWATLIVDPPAGWKDVADRELRGAYREALVRAFVAARDAKVSTEGK